MWALLPRATQILVIVALTAALLLGFQGLNEWWSDQQTSLIKWISTVASFISIVVIGGANLVWRTLWRGIPKLNHWIFPDLNGVWEGTLQSTWIDPEINQPKGPIGATVTIRQTLFSTNIKLQTGESKSSSTRVLAEADRDADVYRFWYSYDNRANAQVAHRSPRHEGVAWLEVCLDEDPDRLTGQYFTDRRTNGDLQLRRVSSATPPASTFRTAV
jgi:hypothetical protein